MGVTTTFRINKVNISTGIEYTGNTVKTAYSAYLYKDVVSTRSSWQTQILSYLVTDTAFIQGIQYLYDRSISYTDSSLIIISDTTNQRVATQVQNGQLQLNYLEIPLSIGYQFVNKRVGIGASAGISAAFLMNQKGNVISTDESRILQAKQENFYRRMVWNVRVGLDVSYQLSGRTAILISPQYRFGIQSIYKPESGLKQRNAAFTMLAGFRYLIY